MEPDIYFKDRKAPKIILKGKTEITPKERRMFLTGSEAGRQLHETYDGRKSLFEGLDQLAETYGGFENMPGAIRDRLKRSMKSAPRTTIEVEPNETGEAPIMSKYASNPGRNVLFEYFTRISSRRQGQDLSKITIRNYVNKINRLSEIVRGGQQEDLNFAWLEDVSGVLKALKECHLSSKKDYLAPVCKILRHEDAHQDLLLKYQNAMSDLKRDQDHERGKNLATKIQQARFVPIDKIRSDITGTDWRQDVDPLRCLTYQLIAAFYFFGDLVPRNDLPLVKLANEKKKASSLSGEFNYVIMGAKGASKMYMCKYKTDSTYGRQMFNIPQTLAGLINTYVTVKEKGNGDFLFTNEQGQPYSDKYFSELVMRAFEFITGKPINIDLIRSIQISDFYNTGPHSINEQETFARKFLHSAQVQQEYLRVNLAGAPGQGDKEGDKTKAGEKEGMIEGDKVETRE